jgi:hypothetical protein
LEQAPAPAYFRTGAPQNLWWSDGMWFLCRNSSINYRLNSLEQPSPRRAAGPAPCRPCTVWVRSCFLSARTVVLRCQTNSLQSSTGEDPIGTIGRHCPRSVLPNSSGFFRPLRERLLGAYLLAKIEGVFLDVLMMSLQFRLSVEGRSQSTRPRIFASHKQSHPLFRYERGMLPSKLTSDKYARLARVTAVLGVSHIGSDEIVLGFSVRSHPPDSTAKPLQK